MAEEKASAVGTKKSQPRGFLVTDFTPIVMEFGEQTASVNDLESSYSKKKAGLFNLANRLFSAPGKAQVWRREKIFPAGIRCWLKRRDLRGSFGKRTEICRQVAEESKLISEVF
ncbi:hypothetical protein ACD591_12260 [Rufibacter glacialis]|uniref:Uncharacterized protein n=1 Tax=Rufibacter glacialis TaxID=1259555 RepID=A0A5M8QMF0_9BACT|nr:hypothetical protein [Rufibacter glacialis]KAA6437259.1 hypothetical protein FOE74_01810 [Rufibacter glacialis]